MSVSGSPTSPVDPTDAAASLQLDLVEQEHDRLDVTSEDAQAIAEHYLLPLYERIGLFNR